MLQRIRAEKERLIKEGKIKRSKKTTSDTQHDDNDAPFVIPESWVWTNIEELLINRDSERIPLSLAVRKKQQNKIYDYYGAAGVIDKVENYLFSERLLLIGEDGANLLSRSKENAFFAEGYYWVNNHAHVLDCSEKYVLDYVAFMINSMSLENYITGSAQPKLTQDNLNKVQIPLPPKEEQKRIIEAVKILMSYVALLDNECQDLTTTIIRVKSKILDLAIHGKLVLQDPNDEPTIELLKRINPKFEPCDNAQYENIPFEVPNSWKWTKIGDILINRDSERIPLSSATRKKQINKIYDYYGAAGVIDKVERYLFSERLLLIGEDGANLLSRSKNNAFFAEGHYWVNNHAHVLDCREKRVLDYVALVINTMSLEKYITGSAQPKLTQDNLNKIPIPLPPYQEQLRIVAKIEELFAVLDEIKESLDN